MKLDKIKLPPVSEEFFNNLKSVFPPINPLDIKPDTSMIEIQRNAAQQEVIKFIENSVVAGTKVNEDTSLLQRIINFRRKHE